MAETTRKLTGVKLLNAIKVRLSHPDGSRCFRN